MSDPHARPDPRGYAYGVYESVTLPAFLRQPSSSDDRADTRGFVGSFPNSGALGFESGPITPKLFEVEEGSNTRTILFSDVEVETREEDLAYDFNDEYQRIYERPAHTPDDHIQRSKDLLQLQDRFISFAVRIGKVIIDELGLSADTRTFAPEEGKGMLGGRKYSVGCVFFKFANDEHNLFGRLEWAEKGALNEIRAVNAVIRSGTAQPHITMPLTAIIRHKGHCLIAAALAPISSDTLVFGSDTAGKRMVETSQLAREALERIARHFHLKPHVVRSTDGKEVLTTPVAADVEVHRSATDGRTYLVDLGRLFSPQLSSTRSHPRAFLYWQFRPEFMRLYCASTPLSSDAFSGFGRDNADEHHRDIFRALQFLLADVVPSVLTSLQAHVLAAGSDAVDGKDPDALLSLPAVHRLSVSDLFHHHGLNLRFLGLVRSRLEPCDAVERAVSKILLIEMTLRTLKTVYKDRLRCKTPCTNADAKQVAVGLFATSPEELQQWIIAKYDVLDGHAMNVSLDDVSSVLRMVRVSDSVLAHSLVLRLMHCFQFTVAESSLSVTQVRALLAGKDPAAVSVRPQVEVTSTPAFATLENAQERFLGDLRIREQVLGPQHPKLLSTLLSLLQLYQLWNQTKPEETLAQGRQVIERMKSLLQQEQVTVQDCVYYNFHIAQFLEARGLFQEAEAGYKHTVEKMEEAELTHKRLFGRVLSTFGSFLGVLRRLDEGEALLQRALSLQLDLLGESHPDTAQTLVNIAVVARKAKQYESAQVYFDRGLEATCSCFGAESAAASNVLNSYGLMKKNQGDLRAAETLYNQCLSIREAKLGPGHWQTARVVGNLAEVYKLMGRHDEAEPLYERALRIDREVFGDMHHDTATALKSLGNFLLHVGRHDEAAVCFEQAMDAFAHLVGAEHAFTKYCFEGLQNARQKEPHSSPKPLMGRLCAT